MRQLIARTALVAIAVTGLAGCLGAADGAESYGNQCTSTDDCLSGEACMDGICYGNPPTGIRLAAVIEPPASVDGPVQVPTEITELEISQTGEIMNLRFSEQVTISGEVILACDPENPDMPCGPIEATIEARRPSAIPGHGPFIRQATATIGPNQETPRFSLSLPPSRCADQNNCEDAYVLTVTPAGSNVMTFGGGELAPPSWRRPSRSDRGNAQRCSTPVVGEPGNLGRRWLRPVGWDCRASPAAAVTALGHLDGWADPVRASTRAVTTTPAAHAAAAQ